MGFAEGEKMRLTCGEGEHEPDRAVLLCKEKWYGEHIEQNEQVGQKEERRADNRIKAEEDKYILSNVKTSTETKKNVLNNELLCVVKC